ncbi:TKL family protein kinase [Trichomonas vaginalis G3]|uniref:TKL family protein kinase n=1 Tax=Trichomonas vaginalis (strain ATCC PRA-98 / G3) TaxID=412133 RepID=A2E7H5_TRIV3|nr:cAMP-dependent protein kinase protein [Trichomonas vaginalis G3]EAY11368.1 TKL family protein kinase [Trichomonas vaginalis G3]KAI5530533.1 cAMP-dependent protein kinase protein [Trichomonas vaginalis G3]|eukprot:XP_001323591.1 TKL family protein kinase [Trichomonas vaginalis G3]
MEGFKIPLAPKFFDTSVKHPGEPFDWVLMDYIPGVTLESLLRNHKRIRLLYILEIITALNLQLKKMGEKGIKHRDLKPGNIVIDADFVPHILDWDDVTTGVSMTQSPYHGTIRFAAPEIFEMKKECASDIFSFGGIIFNMLTGKAPFDDVYNNLDYIFHFIPEEYDVEDVDEQEEDEYEQEDDEDKEKKVKKINKKNKKRS